MTNTDKMTSRLKSSINSKYTFEVMQRLDNAQWQWQLKSGNKAIVCESYPKIFSSRSICIANIENIKHAFIDSRVEIKTNHQ